MLLECVRVTKYFGGLRAVSSVDLCMEQDEILGLIGPNGAGKTTLFNIICGFCQADEGSVLFRGKDISRSKPHEVCKMGVARTFQLVKPFSNLTVLANVRLASYCREGSNLKAEREALDILRFAGLLGKKDYLAKNLTIEDKKRLELTRALATKPALLLLDEIMAGLNPAEMEETISLIKALNLRGITILMVEHVMRAIASLCSRVVVLSESEKIAEGSPEEISKNPRVIESYLGKEANLAAGGRN